MMEGKVSNRHIKKIEIAYKKLYLKSRVLGSQLQKHEQDKIIERVVEEKFFEAFNRLHQQGEITYKNESLDFYEEFKILMQKWRTEMETRIGLYINADGQKWNWFSQNKGGGVVQFVMEMEKLSWVDAIKQLISDCDNVVASRPKVIDAINIPAVSQSQTIYKGEFVLPEKNSTFNYMLAYLINSRCIDKDIVYQFIKEGKLYENKQRSCIFVGFDNTGQARYASVRSTIHMGRCISLT